MMGVDVKRGGGSEAETTAASVARMKREANLHTEDLLRSNTI
jgi:hypothetical protein